MGPSLTVRRKFQRSSVFAAVARFAPKIASDLAVWALAIWLAQCLLVNFVLARVSVSSFIWILLIVGLLQAGIGWQAWLYRGRYRYGSFHEVRLLGLVVLCAGLTMAAFVALSPNWLDTPRSTGLVALPIALLLMFGMRFSRRAFAEWQKPLNVEGTPTLIYGAGELGAILIRHMRSDKSSEYRPVGLIDDDPNKQNLRLDGVTVLGTSDGLREVAERTHATDIVVAFGGVDAEQLRNLQRQVDPLGLNVKMTPSVESMLDDHLSHRDLRDISIEDLLGRVPNDRVCCRTYGCADWRCRTR